MAQLGFSTIALSDPEGNPSMAKLRTQLFSPTRAPANWARVTAFSKFDQREIPMCGREFP